MHFFQRSFKVDGQVFKLYRVDYFTGTVFELDNVIGDKVAVFNTRPTEDDVYNAVTALEVPADPSLCLCSSMVEHRPLKVAVAGSSPVGGTTHV